MPELESSELARRTRRPGPRRAVWMAAVGAAVLHTGAVLWVWRSWTVGLRSGWLVWMDLPVSLLFVEAREGWLLALSLVLGGMQWAVIGGLLSALLGAFVRLR